ncbi:MAG TPA: sensor domain-containing diguanylate cyclase [Sedimenticola sp.]|nr:sensor domain-containing diguanylate cyclase [Sedimenticola sp.]
MSKRFKIYTYSELGDGRYLELGFIDPEINGYFQTLVKSLQQRSDVQVLLFFELWDTLLVPLVQAPVKTFEDKNTLLDQHQQYTHREYLIFRKVTDSEHPYRVESTNALGDPITTYYIQITGLAPEMMGNLRMRFLARVTFNNREIAQIKQQFLHFFWVALGLALLGLAALTYMVRSWFIEPLNRLVDAIENKRPVDLERLPKSAEEFRAIAGTYNQTLAHLRKNMGELERLSIIDPLTGLHNRRYFNKVFRQEVARAARARTALALAMIDLDHFKSYNDHHGHQPGDQLLVRLANHLQQRFKRPSDHICRLGGDEFSVLLTDIDPDSIDHVFDEMRAQWAAHAAAAPGMEAAEISISAGVYIFNGSCGCDWKQAYAQADAALYEAKQKGRNRVVIRRPPGAVRTVSSAGGD